MNFPCKRCTITSLLVSFLLLFSSGSFADGPTGNKFRDREASDDSLGYPSVDEDALLNSQCPQHVELRWQAEVSSSIYATPLIADINNDGKLDIVVPSFVHYLEVLEGSDGDKMPGFPTFHQSYVHSSPLLFDIDKDGMREIALATYNGEVLFFRPSGYQMNEKLVVPRRKIRKDWFVGLVSDAADRSHPDVHDDSLVKDIPSAISMPASNASHSSSNGGDISSVSGSDTNGLKENIREQSHLDSSHSLDNHNLSVEQKENNTEPSLVEMPKSTENILDFASQNNNRDSAHNTTDGTSTSQRHLLESSETKGSEAHGADTTVGGNEGFESKSFNVENEENLEDIADASFDLFRDGSELPEYNYDYDDYPDEAMWGDEEWSEDKHAKLEDYVEVDAHILCTPVIADIDNDGVSEMVVAVSHFFDHEYYANQEHLSELGNLDISKYVAGSVVVFNMDTKQVKWTAQLDMSTDSGTYRAYLYSSPSVVDLDGDGNLDILVGTSFGYFYVFDHQGKIRQNFPLQMGEIQGATVAADINDDGRIELITTDSHGNVAAWTANGDEIWEVHLKSLIPQGPTIGDVDGDGHTDIVIPTISGNIYVLSGKDGSLVRPFPYRTHGRIMSPILLVDLSKRGEKKKGLTLVTTAFDGYLYLIDGSTACADVVDIGETSYSMVLAENVDGGDDLDLIVTTMNGNVFCFSTPAPHHPLKTWTSSFQGRNNVGTRYNREGIYVKSSSRAFRDEEGSNFWVEMEVVDKYKYSAGSQGPYNVTTSLLVPGNYQGLRKISQSQILEGPGKHRVKLPTVMVRTTGTVLVEMVDKNGIYFSDEFSLTFHMHYYKLLKWFMILPMLAMFGILVILRPQEGTPLPSFSTSRHREL